MVEDGLARGVPNYHTLEYLHNIIRAISLPLLKIQNQQLEIKSKTRESLIFSRIRIPNNLYAQHFFRNTAT